MAIVNVYIVCDDYNLDDLNGLIAEATAQQQQIHPGSTLSVRSLGIQNGWNMFMLKVPGEGDWFDYDHSWYSNYGYVIWDHTIQSCPNFASSCHPGMLNYYNVGDDGSGPEE